MSFLGKFEKNVIFKCTRGVALIVIVLLVVALIWGGISFFKDTNYIGYWEVVSAVKETSSTSNGTTDGNNKIPPLVAKYLSGDNAQYLEAWLKNMAPDQQEQFLANLNDVIKTGEDRKISSEQIIQLINKYKDLKMAKYGTSPFGAYTEQIRPYAFMFFTLSIIGMIGLFSLVLVLLAIERNTRPQEK